MEEPDNRSDLPPPILMRPVVVLVAFALAGLLCIHALVTHFLNYGTVHDSTIGSFEPRHIETEATQPTESHGSLPFAREVIPLPGQGNFAVTTDPVNLIVDHTLVSRSDKYDHSLDKDVAADLQRIALIEFRDDASGRIRIQNTLWNLRWSYDIAFEAGAIMEASCFVQSDRGNRTYFMRRGLSGTITVSSLTSTDSLINLDYDLTTTHAVESISEDSEQMAIHPVEQSRDRGSFQIRPVTNPGLRK